MFLIEAMAKAKRGDRAEARIFYQQAKALFDEKFGKDECKFGGGWHNWLTGAILMREAEGLLEE